MITEVPSETGSILSSAHTQGEGMSHVLVTAVSGRQEPKKPKFYSFIFAWTPDCRRVHISFSIHYTEI